MSKFLTAVRPFIFLLIASSASAQVLCHSMHTPAKFESSIEIEAGLTEKSIELVTSTDGTLIPLFKEVSEIPRSIRDYIAQTTMAATPLSFPFDALPISLRVLAAQQSIISKNLKFSQSAGGGRIIPGLKVKDRYQKELEMRAAIDMGTFKTVTDGKLIEFHMRSSKPSGDLVLQANKVFKKIGLSPGPMHMHIVMPLLVKWLQSNPKLNTWRFVEFWRRMNLTFEMRDVVEKGLSLITNQGEGYVSFAPLGRNEIQAVFNYLMAVGSSAKTGAMPQGLNSKGKMGWVGLWGHDKYDGAELMGFEFRFLEGKDVPPQLLEFLNQFAQKMTKQDFGLTEDGMNNWFQEVARNEKEDRGNIQGAMDLLKQVVYEDKFPNLMYERLSPHREYAEMFKVLPYDLQRNLLGMNQNTVNEAFGKRGRLRYLIHDWSQDPILIGKTGAIEKIQNAQLHALRRWARGENETAVMQEFLIESELYLQFAASIGFKA